MIDRRMHHPMGGKRFGGEATGEQQLRVLGKLVQRPMPSYQVHRSSP